jgi:hypothetical protein
VNSGICIRYASNAKRDDAEHVVLFVDVDGIVAEDRLRFDDEVQRGRDGRAGGLRRVLQLRQDVGVDLAVHHLAGGGLHDPTAVALRGEDVERGAAHQVVPFDQGAGVLVEIVGASRDQAVDAAGVRRCAAAIGDEEDRLVALVFRLGQDGMTEVRHPLLEAHDRFLAVLDLKCGISHGIAPMLSIRVPPVRLSGVSAGRSCPLARAAGAADRA